MEGNPNKPVGPLERRPWKGFRIGHFRREINK